MPPRGPAAQQGQPTLPPTWGHATGPPGHPRGDAPGWASRTPARGAPGPSSPTPTWGRVPRVKHEENELLVSPLWRNALIPARGKDPEPRSPAATWSPGTPVSQSRGGGGVADT